jgi:hypothetical protein
VVKKGRYTDQIQHDPGLDRLIGGLARRQHGHVTRRQLLDLGASAYSIKHRVKAGRLIRVHAGVYAVGHLRTSPVARAAAAVLACGPGALLSHGSAAALWGVEKRWRTPIDVTTEHHRRRPGIQIHRSTTLTRRDQTTHLGIRVTSPARTLYDIEPTLSDQALIRAVNDALLSNYLRTADLAEMIERNPGHRDCHRLAGQLDQGAPTRSELEDAFNALTRDFGLPAPMINATVAGREVDALFSEAGVIVEVDGYRFHGTRAAFEDDRERDAQMLLNGLPTVRITWARLKGAPEREASRLKAILGTRPSGRQLLPSSENLLE